MTEKIEGNREEEPGQDGTWRFGDSGWRTPEHWSSTPAIMPSGDSIGEPVDDLDGSSQSPDSDELPDDEYYIVKPAIPSQRPPKNT